MKKRLLPVLLSALVLAACANEPVEQSRPAAVSGSVPASSVPEIPASSSETTPLGFETLPLLDGSTANLPLLAAVYMEMTGVSQDQAEALVSASGTSGAWYSLRGEYCDLLLVYEMPKDLLGLEEQRKLESLPIGRDGLVFLTHKDNPVDSLSIAQLQGIYSGEITNWREVGGEDMPIIAYQRNPTSGSQTLFEKLVLDRDSLMEPPEDWVEGGMGGLISSVADYDNSPGAVGFSVYYYASEMYANPDIKLLAVEGVAPSSGAIEDESYPLVNDFYVVIRANEPAGSPARQLRDWLLGEEGTALLRQAGYVPTPKD